MKLYKRLFILAAVALTGLWVTGCSEDDTLENSKEVYIDILPERIVLSVGDTLPISATVINTAGKTVKTPVTWSLDDESVVNILGDTALVCVAGSLERGTTDFYTTKLRATLVNGKYAVAEVTVQPGVPEGVTADVETYNSYNVSDDAVWFTVSPKALLDDYEPVVTLSNENLTLLDPALTIEKETGRVGVRFASGQKSGSCVITLAIGEGSGVQSASCTVMVQPFVETSLWDPNDSNYPRMKMGELAQYRTYSFTKVMDVNSTSYAYAGVNVPGGVELEIREAMELCRWEPVSGSSVLVTGMHNDFLDRLGFDAVLEVASGAVEGTTVFNYIACDTILEVTFMVTDFKKQPVDEITTNAPAEGIEMTVGDNFLLQVGVIPEASFIYHRPVVTPEDPTIVSVGEYDGDIVTLTALQEGKTNLILTANDKTLTIPVTVVEGISRITFAAANTKALFVGQTVTWEATAVTTSGKPNPYPIEWSSSDPAVVTAAAGAEPTSSGTITAVSAGKADITATVAGRSVTAAIEVLALPVNVTYTASNTSKVAVGNNGNNLRIQLTGPAGEEMVIVLTGYRNQFDFDVQDMSVVSVTYNGVGLQPASGWLKGTDLGSATLFSFELNFEVAGKTFTLKATDLEG